VVDEKRDRELGMGCPISRRDFLNGVAIGIGSAFASEPLLAVLAPEEFAARSSAPPPSSPESAADYYPPGLTGIRGNHNGTFTYAHRLRDGESWMPTAVATTKTQ
jgi:spermidine dehydrogenase